MTTRNVSVLAVERARLKLSEPTKAGVEPFEFDDLPSVRIDDVWEKIKEDYSLTLQELSALKNARCSKGLLSLFIHCHVSLDMEISV